MGVFDKYLIDDEEEKKDSIFDKYIAKTNTATTPIQTQLGAGAKAEVGATLTKPPPDILQTSPTASGALGISEPLDLDSINKYVAAPLKGISHGIYSAPQAIGGLMRNLGEVSGELKTAPKIFMGGDEKYKELIEAKTKSPEIEVDKLIASKGQDIIKANREFLEAKKLSTKGEDKVEDFLFNLGSGATSLAGAIGISVLTGSPHAAAVAFGLYQKGTLYQEAREAGVGVKKAEALSTVGGVIEGALEYIGLELLFSKMGGGALVNTVMHAGTEGFQEFSQTVGENIVAKIGWDGQRNVLQGAGESALIGALLGAPASVITSNAEKGIDLQNITEQEKHQLIAKIIEKQLGAIGATLQNLNPATIMEKVKTDPDIQKAIIGVLQGEVFEPVTLGKEAEEPPTPKALEPLAEEKSITKNILQYKDENSEEGFNKIKSFLNTEIGKNVTKFTQDELKKLAKTTDEGLITIYRSGKDIDRTAGWTTDFSAATTIDTKIITKAKVKPEDILYWDDVFSRESLDKYDESEVILKKPPEYIRSQLKVNEIYKKYENDPKYKGKAHTAFQKAQEEISATFKEKSLGKPQLFTSQPEPTAKPTPAPKAEVKGEAVKEVKPKIPKDVKIKDVYNIGEKITKGKVKPLVRKVTGQTMGDVTRFRSRGEKIEVYESNILKLVLEGEVKGARKAFKAGKEEGIFKQKEHFTEVVARLKERVAQKGYIDKLIKDINKLPTQNMAVDYKEMIEDIQGEFDLKKRTAKTIARRARLANYIEKQAELDHDVDIPQDQIDMIRKKPLNDMTIEELETVHDNIMHLAHLGKTKGKLLKVAEKRSVEKQVDTLIDTITKGEGITIKDVIKTGKEDKTFFQRAKEAGQTYHYNTVRAERLFEQADNFKDSGEFWNTFFKPVNEATYQEQDNYGAGLDNFREFIKDNNIDIGKFLVDKQEINDRVTLTSTEKVEVFLATFDKDKMRHMIRGNNFTEKDVTDVINSLTKEEKAMGEYLVKHYEAQYKGINDIYKKLTGKDMPKIPGYSPIRLLSETIDTSRDVIESLLTKYNVRPSIRKGFTKERTGGAIQPLSLDAVNNFMFNLSRVEHYKAFVLPIRDINKLLSNPKLIEAIRQKKGNPFYQNMKSWLLDVSDTNPGVSFDQVDKIARLLRTRAADAMLGFNVVSAMKQPISVLNACAEIGISNVLNGIQQLTKSPVATTKFVYEKSPLVRNRKGQFDRVISELEQSKNIKQIIKQTKTKSDVIIGLLKFMDQQSVKAVWKGAYDQGLGKNMTDQQAIDYADKVVRKTQPMAGVKDLSKWFRGGTLSKMFTMFQNQINNNYNYYTHDILGKYRAGEIGVGKVAYRVAFSYVMPALLMGMISRGRLPKDKEGFRDLISFPIAGLFFVGSIVRNMIEGWDSFSIPPLSWANDVIKAGTMKRLPTKMKYGLSALAKVLGIPWNQPYRTVKGMIDYLGGATDDLRRLIYSEYALAEKKKKSTAKPAELESFKKYSTTKKSVFEKYTPKEKSAFAKYF